MAQSPVKTLVVDNFRGGLTIYQYGDINSGRGYAQTNSGQNPFVKPGQLTWAQVPVQIDEDSAVITDLILDGEERIENGIIYVYAIGHTGRLYKIQSNDPTTYNPNYDNPVLLATLSIESPTFTRGGYIEFYGATEKIYIGHDKGVTSINFDGTGEAFVGALGSWTQDVPRVMQEFIGKLYVANGSNLAEIDSTATVTTYTKLTPGFPDNSQVRDLDLTQDGNYLESVVTRLPLEDITSPAQSINNSASTESHIFQWNGIDQGYTAFNTYPSFSLTANTMFQKYQYVFGTDQYGAALYDSGEKILGFAEYVSPLPNAVASTGNMVNWMSPVYYLNVLEADFESWGNLDFEVGHPGWWDLFFLNAKPPETDIVRTPFVIPVSNAGLGASSNSYPGNVFSTSKIYFSTLETSGTPTTAYRFYKWSATTSPDIAQPDALPFAIYQTQSQMFSKRIKVREVRIYSEPWVANNSFEIAMIGAAGTPITGGTRIFDTADGTLTVGADYVWYNPEMENTYALGFYIMNLGTANHVINKVEIDYAPGGE